MLVSSWDSFVVQNLQLFIQKSFAYYKVCGDINVVDQVSDLSDE